MNKEQFERMKNELAPGEAAVRALYKKLEQEGAGKKSNKRIIKAFAPLAACLLILLSGVLLFNKLKPAIIEPASLSDEVKGLPVNNFKLSEMKMNVAMCRRPDTNIMDFFRWYLDCFVIVKVTDTQFLKNEEWKFDDRQLTYDDRQLAHVKVLKNVYGDCDSDDIQIVQYIYGDLIAFTYDREGGEITKVDGVITNLLRENGVYLLPLWKHKDLYYINGDLDVLFEIDGKGRVYSHSEYKDFNRFDGRRYSRLVAKIKRITGDEKEMLLMSRFGKNMRYDKLIEVVVTSEGQEIKHKHGDYEAEDIYFTEIVQQARVINNFSMVNIPEEISLFYYDYEDMQLDKDGRYLLFVDKNNGKYHVIDENSALIQTDGTVKCLPSEYKNVFLDYEGHTVGQIKETADEVNQYLKKYKLTEFGIGALMNQVSLVEVVVTSEGREEKSEAYYVKTMYQARILQNLSNKNIPSETIIYSHTYKNVRLTKGNHYLLFLNEDNYRPGEYFITDFDIANINSDRTIQCLENGGSIFSDYDGYTVEEIKELADEVNRYMAKYRWLKNIRSAFSDYKEYAVEQIKELADKVDLYMAQHRWLKNIRRGFYRLKARFV